MKTDHTSLTKISKHTRLALYAAVFTVGIFLFWLIAKLHQQNVVLNDTNRHHLLSSANSEAHAISYFFQTRLVDITELAQHPTIASYYRTKDLGMLRQYGLDASISLMEKQFERFLFLNVINGTPIYCHAGYKSADNSLNILKKYPSADYCNSDFILQQEADNYQGAEASRIYAGNSKNIVITLPYIHDGIIVGHIFSSIPVHSLKTYLSQFATDIPHKSFLLHPDNPPIPITDEGPMPFPAYKLSGLRIGSIEPLNFSGGDGSFLPKLQAIRLTIPNSSYELVSVFEIDDVYSLAHPQLKLFLLSLIASATLVTALLAVRMDLRNTSLKARLEESSNNRERIQLQNTLLQQEIRDRKSAEEREVTLRSQAEKVNMVIPSAIVSLDQNGLVTAWNNRAEEITGYPSEDAIGKHYSFLYAATSAASHMISPVSSRGIQYEIRTRSGSTRTVIKNREPLFDSAGSIIGAVDSFEDITDQQRTLAALAIAEENYRTIFSNAPYGIYQSTEDGHLLSLNPSMVAMFEYSCEEEMRTALQDRLEALYARPESRREYLRRMNRHGFVHNFEAQVVTRTGKKLWVIENARVFTTPDGSPGFEGFIHDITLQKEAENLLIEAKETAETANRAKSQFLANISHEIRTPMMAILGMADMNLRLETDPKKMHNLQVLRDAASSLLKLLNQLLDFARIEAGAIDMEYADFSPRKLVSGIRDLLKVEAQNKGIRLHTECAADLPMSVIGDRDRLRQILINLVGNAVKFTETGSVTIGCAPGTPEHGALPLTTGMTKPEQPDATSGAVPEADTMKDVPEWLTFTIRDTGIGIPENKLSLIFQSFAQADGSITRKFGGAGLGLAISKHLIEMMGGEIRVNSTMGAGTTFSVTIPFGRCKAGTPPPASQEMDTSAHMIVQGLRILVAEDNPFNQIVISQMLEFDNHLATIAENGEKALELLEKQEFDLVLMDIQMPVLDGIDSARTIRSGTRAAIPPHIPVIALSAHIRSEEQPRFADAGFNAYLSKPLAIEDLRQLLLDLFPHRGQEAGPGQLQVAETQGTIPTAKLSDFEEISRLLSGRKNVIITLLTLYAQTMPGTATALEECLMKGNCKELQRLTHSVKSSIRNIGAIALADMAKELEDAARDEDLTQAMHIFPSLRLGIHQTVSEAKCYLSRIDELLSGD
ncbi:MAG: ATP-binding protein [Halodesulfovibrio sp.]